MGAAHSGAAFLQIAVACTPQILQITAQHQPLFVKSACSFPAATIGAATATNTLAVYVH